MSRRLDSYEIDPSPPTIFIFILPTFFFNHVSTKHRKTYNARIQILHAVGFEPELPSEPQSHPPMDQKPSAFYIAN